MRIRTSGSFRTELILSPLPYSPSLRRHGVRPSCQLWSYPISQYRREGGDRGRGPPDVGLSRAAAAAATSGLDWNRGNFNSLLYNIGLAHFGLHTHTIFWPSTYPTRLEPAGSCSINIWASCRRYPSGCHAAARRVVWPLWTAAASPASRRRMLAYRGLRAPDSAPPSSQGSALAAAAMAANPGAQPLR